VVSIDKAKVPTLLEWRSLNMAHLVKLEGLPRRYFSELTMMYETLLEAGHDFGTVYKFSLDQAEICRLNPATPFDANALAARHLVSVVVPGKGKSAIGGYSGSKTWATTDTPCEHYNLYKGCRYPDGSCRAGPHKCTVCHKFGRGHKCSCRTNDGGGGRAKGGRDGGRGKGGRDKRG